MENLHRAIALDALLRNSRRPVPKKKILEELECSASTFKRLLQTVRDQYDAPIRYDKRADGYYYDQRADTAFSLPGFWFNESELFALLTVQQLLQQVPPGLLGDRIDALQERVSQLLSEQLPESPVARIRLAPLARKTVNEQHFSTVAVATLSGKRLHIHYRDQHNRHSERTLSPQRILYYRDNWYLDAWCHYRSALRTFSLGAIQQVNLLPEEAVRLMEPELDAYFRSSYGIFAGAPKEKAVLRFSPEIAHRLTDTHWHHDQQIEWLDDGGCRLIVPYSDFRELVMDILRFGPQVEVVAPDELREEVIQRLRQALAVYE